jgi:hypothetical protein
MNVYLLLIALSIFSHNAIASEVDLTTESIAGQCSSQSDLECVGLLPGRDCHITEIPAFGICKLLDSDDGSCKCDYSGDSKLSAG